MASQANSDVTRRSQRIHAFDYAMAPRPVVDNAYRRMDQAVLYSLRPRSKLADGDVQLPIDHVIWWPRMWLSWIVVEQVSYTGWEAEHRQYASVRKSLAQAVLRVTRVCRAVGDLPGQLLRAIVGQKLSLRLKMWLAVRKQDIDNPPPPRQSSVGASQLQAAPW